uniref:Uncharacterized protein n=1 Tax=Tanacetum cinerariifolium TaxID=118510 RepID=A0A6L2M6D6_TANCI|nr:hypothetical protein [Tanacetum cinerariifolium]
MNAEKVVEHGSNDVNRLNLSQQFTYEKMATIDRVKNKVNFHSLEAEVGDVDADLIIPMTSGLDDLLENKPYMIQNVLIILKKWSPDANLSKEDLTKVPMWVKLYNVPMVTFTSKGLSHGSSARALIELDDTYGLKDRLVVAIRKSEGSDYRMETIRQMPKLAYQNKTTNTSVSNAFSALEEDNGKSMDVSVDDTWKKMEAPPKKTP